MKIAWLATLICALVAMDNACQAQSPEVDSLFKKKWSPGEVILNDGTLLKGDINFDFSRDRISIKRNDEVSYFGKSQILEIQIQDLDQGEVLVYKSLKLPIGHAIYQVIAENGEAAFLISRSYEMASEMTSSSPGDVNSPPILNPTGRTLHYTIDRLLIVRSNGDIQFLGQLSKAENHKSNIKLRLIRKLLKEFDPKIKRLIDQKDIDLRKRNQLIRAIKLAVNGTQ